SASELGLCFGFGFGLGLCFGFGFGLGLGLGRSRRWPWIGGRSGFARGGRGPAFWRGSRLWPPRLGFRGCLPAVGARSTRRDASQGAAPEVAFGASGGASVVVAPLTS